MSKARLTFETSPARKSALETALDGAGVSLPEWFEGSVAEATGELFSWPAPEEDRTQHSGACVEVDLDQPQKVLDALKRVQWDFASEETGYLSHDIHPYPAKFIPQLPHYLIRLLSRRGETVLDPFGGSGTTALEATLLGGCGLSSDANPLATIIGEAKTSTLRREDDEVLSRLAERWSLLARQPQVLKAELERHRSAFTVCIPREPTLAQWFAPAAVDELAYAVWCISQLPSKAARSVALATFSKSILKTSFQDGETRYVRKPREVEMGATLKRLSANILLNQKKVRQLGPLLRFRQPTFKTVDLRAEDAVGTAGPHSWDAECADLIVTSPPYPNATDYHLYHRFRLLWLGFDPRALGRQEIGSHLRHQRQKSGFETYLEEMTCCLRAMWRALRPGRYAVLVVGDGIFAGQVYRTSEALSEAARAVGFEVVGEIDRTLPDNKRSFVAAARRLRQEQLLVLRRPSRAQKLQLLAPPYRLWPYEAVLREREIVALTGQTPQPVDSSASSEDRRSGHSLFVSQTEEQSFDTRLLSRLAFTHGVLQPSSGHIEPTWQAILENGDAASPSARKDPKYVTHGIHAYKGKFYPQLAKSLFNLAGLRPGQAVLDPFCGSGTVLLEAYLNGLHGYGLDVHPLAVHIAASKAGVLEADPFWCDRLLSDFERTLERLQGQDDETGKLWQEMFSIATHDELASWFPIPVLNKLARLWRHIEDVPELRVRDLLQTLLSSLVRDVSQQDPRDLRIRRRAQPIEDAAVYSLFASRLRETRARLQSFAARSPSAPAPFLPVKVERGDGRELQSFAELGLGRGSVDAVVTSPPYATALPYIDTDRLSLLLLFGLRSKDRVSIEDVLVGSREISPKKRAEVDALIDADQWNSLPSATGRDIVSRVRRLNRDGAERGEAVGFRRQNTASLLYLYFRDMAAVMSNLNTLLKPGGQAFFVIGDSRTLAGGEDVRIASSQVLQETGESFGWKLREVLPITVTTDDRPHVKNSITSNDVLWFSKER